MNCKKYKCPKCGDRLIHQENRGKDESSSALGQYVHDKFPNTFWWMDIDAIIYKKTTRILRIIERKKLNGNLRPSQQFLLPILSICINLLCNINMLNEQSGVFFVKTEIPFTSAIIQEIKPYIDFSLDNEIYLKNNDLCKFYMGEKWGEENHKMSNEK